MRRNKSAGKLTHTRKGRKKNRGETRNKAYMKKEIKVVLTLTFEIPQNIENDENGKLNYNSAPQTCL